MCKPADPGAHLMSADCSSHLGPRANYVFVDGENVHQIDPASIWIKVVHVTLMLGATQTKLNAALIETLTAQAKSLQCLRAASPGRNALDLTLSYYVGRAVVADPTGYFHIVSKDRDFDPLIEHLRSRNIEARRHDDFSTLTFSVPKKSPAKPTPPPVIAPLLAPAKLPNQTSPIRAN